MGNFFGSEKFILTREDFRENFSKICDESIGIYLKYRSGNLIDVVIENMKYIDCIDILFWDSYSPSQMKKDTKRICHKFQLSFDRAMGIVTILRNRCYNHKKRGTIMKEHEMLNEKYELTKEILTNSIFY